MRRHVKGWSRPAATLVVALMGWTLAAPPANADAITRPSAGISKASVAAAVARAAATAPRAALAQDAGASSSAETTGGFLSSTKGKVAAVLFVAGTAWTIYSVSDSRKPVKSPIR